jgi:hypothetical protein
MEWNWLVPVLIVGFISLSVIMTTWLRAKHGYPLEDDEGRLVHKTGSIEDGRKIALLSNENEKLQSQVLRLEERIAVLERIATDPAERTAREIEALRRA